MYTSTLAVILAGALLTSCVQPIVAETTHQHKSGYAGQEKRLIKSLSRQDITDLRAGAGWGLAKAAELNGVPGPVHLLEMKSEIRLTAEQIAAITNLYAGMKKTAMDLGEQLIEQELQLEKRFQSDLPSEGELKTLLNAIGETRSKLRFAHLAAHLKTPEILSKEQIDAYNNVRGYGASNPCDKVPAGHSPAMWKRHNGCG